MVGQMSTGLWWPQQLVTAFALRGLRQRVDDMLRQRRNTRYRRYRFEYEQPDGTANGGQQPQLAVDNVPVAHGAEPNDSVARR
jgi:hypothetical protein